MRVIIGIIAGLLIATSAEAQMVLGATDITAADVQAFIKESPRDRNSDRPIRVVDVGGYRMAVFGVFRPKNATPNSANHQTKAAEVYYMLEGAGELVTGGTQTAPVRSGNSSLGNWTDVASTGIDGGVARRVAKGDVVIIPGGVPHSWRSLEGDITYLIIRSDPNNQITLK